MWRSSGTTTPIPWSWPRRAAPTLESSGSTIARARPPLAASRRASRRSILAGHASGSATPRSATSPAGVRLEPQRLERDDVAFARVGQVADVGAQAEADAGADRGQHDVLGPL